MTYVPSDGAQLVSDADERELAEHTAAENEYKQQNSDEELDCVEDAPGRFRHLYIGSSLVCNVRRTVAPRTVAVLHPWLLCKSNFGR